MLIFDSAKDLPKQASGLNAFIVDNLVFIILGNAPGSKDLCLVCKLLSLYVAFNSKGDAHFLSLIILQI